MLRSLEVLVLLLKNILSKSTDFRINIGDGVAKTMTCTRGKHCICVRIFQRALCDEYCFFFPNAHYKVHIILRK